MYLEVMSVATAQYKNFGLEDVKEGGEAGDMESEIALKNHWGTKMG